MLARSFGLALIAMTFYALRNQTLGSEVLVVGSAFFVFAFLFGTLLSLFQN